MADISSAFLKDIFIYPIKSLGGIPLQNAFPEERGLPFDRRWLLVDNNNAFLTQRKHSIMSLLKVSLKKEGLEVRHQNNILPTLKIPFDTTKPDRIAVTLFDELIIAPRLNNREVDDWFSHALGEAVKLIYMDASTRRPVDPKYAKHGEEVSFADGYPYLITNQASLEDLNEKLDQPILMDRFRPNFVVAGMEPFEEDNWKKVSIGSAVFEVAKPCGRCKITSINQSTGEKGKEPLNTLSTYRKFNNKIIFGQNLILIKPGEIRVEDEVIIEYK